MGKNAGPLVANSEVTMGSADGALMVSSQITRGPAAVMGRTVVMPFGPDDIAALLAEIAGMPSARGVWRRVHDLLGMFEEERVPYGDDQKERVADHIRGLLTDPGRTAQHSGEDPVGEQQHPVYALLYADQHGDYVSLHASEVRAHAALAGICRESWQDARDRDHNEVLPASPDGLSDEEVIAAYFDVMGARESWEVTETLTPGPE